MGNVFGTLFRITTFGESHGPGIGVVVDGCPAGLKISEECIQKELERRRPGQSKLTTARAESDIVQIQSGIFEGTTLGTPIGLYVANQDARSGAYNELKDLYRPSHADYTYEKRYGFRDWRGGGRSSNRESVGRVAAGAIAKCLLKELVGMECVAWVEQIHLIKSGVEMEKVTLEQVEKSQVRCPDPQATEKMTNAILEAKKNGDSLGGEIGFRINHCPAGLGSPVFHKLTADIAQGIMSIAATRSVSFGIGGKSIEMTGWEHNDPIILNENKEISTETNKAGGILGGISNGEPIYGTVIFKPTATINREQKTVTRDKKEVTLKARGRHDPCVLPRAVPIVEAMLNLVLADHLLLFSIANLKRLKKVFTENEK